MNVTIKYEITYYDYYLGDVTVTKKKNVVIYEKNIMKEVLK